MKRDPCVSLPGFLFEISRVGFEVTGQRTYPHQELFSLIPLSRSSSLLPPTRQIVCADTKRFCALNNGIKLWGCSGQLPFLSLSHITGASLAHNSIIYLIFFKELQNITQCALALICDAVPLLACCRWIPEPCHSQKHSHRQQCACVPGHLPFISVGKTVRYEAMGQGVPLRTIISDVRHRWPVSCQPNA